MDMIAATHRQDVAEASYLHHYVIRPEYQNIMKPLTMFPLTNCEVVEANMSHVFVSTPLQNMTQDKHKILIAHVSISIVLLDGLESVVAVSQYQSNQSSRAH